MKFTCSLCGRKVEISKMHKDYQRLMNNPNAPFICNYCTDKVKYESQEKNKPKKPV